MAEEVKKTIDTTQETSPTILEPEIKQARGAFSKVKRELSDADFKKPAVGRLLLNQNDKYEQEIALLKEYKEKFHEADKKAEVLTERLSGIEKSITGKSILLILGSLLTGFLPSLWEQQKFFWSAAIIALILFLIALLKPFQKYESRNK